MLLTIEKLVYGGDGLARAPAGPDGRSMAVFVPFVLPGEQVEAEIRPGNAGFARAVATELVAASSERIEPRCPYFQRCGGCHYQHIPYERQLAFKAQILRETLERVGKIKLNDEIRVHPSPPWNYRNRARMRVRSVPEFVAQDGKTSRSGDPRFALGYYRFGSREFLPVRECPISSPLINGIIARLTELGGLGCPAGVEEIEFFADASDEYLLAWAFCRDDAHAGEAEPPHHAKIGRPPQNGKTGRAGGPGARATQNERSLVRWAEALRSELPNLIGVSFLSSPQRADEEGPSGVKVLAQSGAKSIRYRTASGEYQVSPAAFFQVNRHLVDELVSVVTGDGEGDVAFDLYAGGGLFSVPLAERFRHIFAVEASQTSFSDLKQNVPASVKVVGTRTEEYLRSAPVRTRPDLVVLDPPRSGVGKTVTRSLVELGARRIRYVSCDPATQARDLAPLIAAGYRIKEAHLFDHFPQTFHIESVMLLER